MEKKDLFSTLKKYFLNNPDLMRHLHINACWEYIIYKKSLKEKEIVLKYYLYKKDENNLAITQKNPNIIPDLILYFTKESVLQIIQDHPSSEIYYERYHTLMKDISKNKVDSKINKSRFNLLRLGYQKWQKDFKF
jgi:hypothetical protein